MDILRAAKRNVFGDTEVQFVRGSDITINVRLLDERPFPEHYVALEFGKLLPRPHDPDLLFLDIETHNAGREYDMPIDKFFRLGQYAFGNDPVTLTTGLDEVYQVMRAAKTVVVHNGFGFDFRVLLGAELVDWTWEGRLFDTFVHANLVFPAPYSYTNRAGHTFFNASAPGQAMKWLGLDNLGFQFGAGAKEGDLKALAKKYNPKGTKVADLNYGLIPTDDPEFRAYGEQDVLLLREVFYSLMYARPLNAYDEREQKKAAINAAMTHTGIAIDRDLARERVEIAEAIKAEKVAELEREYGFPTEGAMPWRSNPGRAAIFRALADVGVTPETHPDWPKTATDNPSLGGEALIELTAGTKAEGLGVVLAQLMGQRPLAQQALDHVKSDGRVHPSIAILQRSGRSSVTKPGITTWSRDNIVEKDYIVARPGHVLMEFDLSNADQRILAALSGDMAYAARFEPGVDGHEINGRLMFGDEVYDSDPKHYRNEAKAPGHAMTYGAQAEKLAETAGLPVETMQAFLREFAKAYPDLTRWQDEVRADGEKGELFNRWGRRMVIDRRWNDEWGVWRSRSFTQSPALHGQSGTTEVLFDGLFKLYEYDATIITNWLVCTIHDAALFDVPLDRVDYLRAAVVKCMEQTINGVRFPVSYGEPGRTWAEASH